MNPSSLTILIVDDEADLREAIAFDFRRKKFNVLTASCGNDAIKIVERERIDLVLSDVRMPNGDGIELLDRIKDRNVFLPVVMFITGFTDITLDEAYDRGADAVFSKPFDRKVLMEAVLRAVQPPDRRFLRKVSRVEFELPVGVKFLKSSFSFESKARNIGRGGMFVELADRLPEINEEVEFKIESTVHPEVKIEGRGIVRWTRTIQTSPYPAGCGIEFFELEPRSNSRITELVNFLKTRSFIPKS